MNHQFLVVVSTSDSQRDDEDCFLFLRLLNHLASKVGWIERCALGEPMASLNTMSCAPDGITPDRTVLVGRVRWVSKITNVPVLYSDKIPGASVPGILPVC